MPSSTDPSIILSGAGKIHPDVVTAAAELFVSGGGGGGVTPDILAQTLAAPAVTASTVANSFSGDATYTFPSGVYWVGSSSGENLGDLFQVVGDDDTSVFNAVSHQYVQVASINTTVGGGFFTGALTLTFNVSVPPSKSYKIFYCKQAILSSLPKELASFPTIRRAADRVRFPEFDRTSLAPTSVAVPLDITNIDYPDPYMAQWKAIMRGTAGTVSSQTSGSTGFVYVGRKKNVNDSNDVSLTGHQATAFLSVYEKEITSTTLNGQTVLTKIDPSLTATVNPTGTANVIFLNAGDYFRTSVGGVNKTALRVGLDMLEITFFQGNKEVYIISTLDPTDPRKATLMTLAGGPASFPSTQSVNVKWIRPNTFFGGDTDFQATGIYNMRGFQSLVAGSITNDPNSEIAQEAPFFAAGTTEVARQGTTNNPWNLMALRWGGYNQSAATPDQVGQRQVGGYLQGDGSVISFSRVVGLHNNRTSSFVFTVSSGVPLNFTGASQYTFTFSGTSTLSLNLTMDANYTPTNGDTCTIFVAYSGSGTAIEASTVTWPGIFKFSGHDAVTSSKNGTILKYTGNYFNGSFYMTRTDYLP